MRGERKERKTRPVAARFRAAAAHTPVHLRRPRDGDDAAQVASVGAQRGEGAVERGEEQARVAGGGAGRAVQPHGRREGGQVARELHLRRVREPRRAAAPRRLQRRRLERVRPKVQAQVQPRRRGRARGHGGAPASGAGGARAGASAALLARLPE